MLQHKGRARDALENTQESTALEHLDWATRDFLRRWHGLRALSSDDGRRVDSMTQQYAQDAAISIFDRRIAPALEPRPTASAQGGRRESPGSGNLTRN